MPQTPPESTTRYLSPLAADIEAEFGALLHAGGEGGQLSAAKADVLCISFEQAAQALPQALRRSFVRNCTERLTAHFGRDYREICESQFHEAVAVIGQQIIETRNRIDKLAIELPRAEDHRWRVTFFDLTR
jgi:hypothetical protein